MLILAAACTLWATVSADAATHGIKFAELPADQRKTFLTTYNAAPPVSHIKPDHIFIAKDTDDPDKRFVMLVTGKCLTGAGSMSPSTLDSLINGDPA